MPTSIAELDANFLQHIFALKDQSKRIYIATLSGDSTTGACDMTNQREWQMPPVVAGWNQDLFNIAGIRAAFDRTNLNALYIRSLNTGRASDCIATKKQIDWIAALGRAFFLRHQSSIRANMHAATRRRGHSTWNDATGAAATLTDLGGGTKLGASDTGGPVGGIFTTMVRHLLLTINDGYNV